ncbi:inlA [Symbiodinium necroappetens]|uniref:InlA protein n=1 Tax=Symbiodinium necroappetens TaxID=1628268 RepID=A0A812LMI0_9DINO|nr:inlA [Symbiodinium necroappetens]
MQMLTERTILEENAFDRSLMGTKDLLCKYAQCDKVWMEVLLKAASALMVAVAAMNSRWLAVAVALTMAAVVAVASPFAQPQINVLQCLCFCCLALSAVGFTCEGLLGVCLTCHGCYPPPKSSQAPKFERSCKAGTGVYLWLS